MTVKFEFKSTSESSKIKNLYTDVCTMTYIKVEGHSEYVREEKSHAIINTDTSTYTSYMKMMENKKKQKGSN